ncbi:MAG: hypothetical protein N4A48_06355 [Tepidibacter sp.]|jgi:hypothetical protein|uniref:hypothetical protein n=1 Tax=Tepidibacter sp. TaxID=2529387 RepID=UPI0025F22C50|nr:hypothetical protein [Tepidibacter sp.]MCT4508372.1 hypothetical protein [Tepidibacter sp.]
MLCGEVFKFEHESKDVKVNSPFSSSANIDGNIYIHTLKCCIVNPPQNNKLQVDAEFLVREDLTISEGSDLKIPLEYLFRINERFTFNKCELHNIHCFNSLKCEVVCICGENDMHLNSDNHTITQKLKICLKIKIFKDNKIILDLQCPKFPSCT